MPRGVERGAGEKRACAFPGCGREFTATKARQVYCRATCRAKHHQQRRAMQLMPIDDIVALIDELKLELVRRAKEWGEESGRRGKG